MRAFFAAAGAALFLSPLIARAQIVNVQPLVETEQRPGFSGLVEGALDFRTGNTDYLLFAASGSARYRWGRHLLLAVANGNLGSENGERFVNRDLEHFRYRWERFARVHFETFVQRDRDPFRRLVLRTLGGAGPRFLLATTGATVTALGVAYMLEYERLSAGDFPDSAEEQLAHRLSAYAVVTVKLNELLSFGETLFAQPRFGRPRDYRLLSETQWVVAVNKSVSLKAALSMAYDNRPPASRRPLDTATRMSVQLKF